jgi:hypothetical protein
MGVAVALPILGTNLAWRRDCTREDDAILRPPTPGISPLIDSGARASLYLLCCDEVAP